MVVNCPHSSQGTVKELLVSPTGAAYFYHPSFLGSWGRLEGCMAGGICFGDSWLFFSNVEGFLLILYFLTSAYLG